MLVAPGKWEDPFENFLAGCCLTSKANPGNQQFFDKLRKPTYGQCWSAAEESDTLWRAYSYFRRDPTTARNALADWEGIKVRSTPHKLLRALWRWCPSEPSKSCFVGKVRYLPQNEILQYVADEVGRNDLRAFSSGRGHADSLLFKRSAFANEAEVRVIYVEMGVNDPTHVVVRVPIDPNEVFEEVSFDPRLATFEMREREDEVKRMGYTGAIGTSDLYQRVLLEILVP